MAISLKLLGAAKPIWYRSTCKADNQDWSWYGLGAEDVAALDPRLVHWGYQEEDYDSVEVRYWANIGTDPATGDDKYETLTRLEPRLRAGATLKPDAVQYDRFVPHLIAGWQAHEARLAAIEARLH